MPKDFSVLIYDLSLMKNKKYIIPISLLAILLISLSLNLSSAKEIEDEEDEKDGQDDDGGDLAENFGVVAIVLLALGFPHIFFILLVKHTSSYSKEDEKLMERRKKILGVYKKWRKPLFYLHKAVGYTIILLILYHAIIFTSKDNETVVLGLITGSILLFYVISAFIVKRKLFGKTFRKNLGKIHRNPILYIILIVLHIVHLA